MKSSPSIFRRRPKNPNLDVFLAALGEVAKARGMAQIARDAGLGRERPRFETISAILRALGVKFAIVPQKEAMASEP